MFCWREFLIRYLDLEISRWGIICKKVFCSTFNLGCKWNKKMVLGRFKGTAEPSTFFLGSSLKFSAKYWRNWMVFEYFDSKKVSYRIKKSTKKKLFFLCFLFPSDVILSSLQYSIIHSCGSFYSLTTNEIFLKGIFIFVFMYLHSYRESMIPRSINVDYLAFTTVCSCCLRNLLKISHFF